MKRLALACLLAAAPAFAEDALLPPSDLHGAATDGLPIMDPYGNVTGHYGTKSPTAPVFDYNVVGDLSAAPAPSKTTARRAAPAQPAAAPAQNAPAASPAPSGNADTVGGIRTDSSPLGANGSLSGPDDVSDTDDVSETTADGVFLPGNGKINATRTERRQQLMNDYQTDLRNAPNGAAASGAMTKYGTYLQPSFDNSTLPAEQRVKLRAQSLDEAGKQIDAIKQSGQPAAVRTLNSEAAQDKATSAFRSNQPGVLQKVIDSRVEQIKAVQQR